MKATELYEELMIWGVWSCKRNPENIKNSRG